MSKRLTMEEVRNYINVEIDCGTVLLSTEYIDSKTKMLFRCVCDAEFLASFHQFKTQKKHVCRDCAWKKVRKSHEQFVGEMKDIHGDSLTVIGEYQGDGRKVKMKCNIPQCESTFESAPSDMLQGTGCPYCSCNKINHTNSLGSLYPEIAVEWNYKKNEKTPADFGAGSPEIVYWSCKKNPSHAWRASIHSRTMRKQGCPYCSGRRVYVGENDIATTHPELAQCLTDPSDATKYSKSVKKKVKWNCEICGDYINEKEMYSVNKPPRCFKCADTISYPEKFMRFTLIKNDIPFEAEKRDFSWLTGERYDFYLPEKNWIIEVHGIQHYQESGLYNNNGKDLKSIQNKDKYKENLAIINGVEKYIVIDARKSEAHFIQSSIINSPLSELINKELFDDVIELSRGSLLSLISSLWESGLQVKEIEKEVGLGHQAIKKYLNEGTRIGLCDYNRSEAMKRSKALCKPVAQLTENGEFVNSYQSITEAGLAVGRKKPSLISRVLNGKAKIGYGYRWMYLEEYEKSNINNSRL